MSNNSSFFNNKFHRRIKFRITNHSTNHILKINSKSTQTHKGHRDPSTYTLGIHCCLDRPMLLNDRFDHQNLRQIYLVALRHPEHKHFFVKNDFERNIQISASLWMNNLIYKAYTLTYSVHQV